MAQAMNVKPVKGEDYGSKAVMLAPDKWVFTRGPRRKRIWTILGRLQTIKPILILPLAVIRVVLTNAV